MLSLTFDTCIFLMYNLKGDFMKKETYRITGMHCAACSSAVERVTRKLDGVVSSEVNLATGIMTIVYDEGKCGPEKIMPKVEKAGFGIEPFVREEKKAEKKKEEKERFTPKMIIAAAVFSGLLLYISMGQMIFENLPVPDIISMKTHPVNFALIQLVLSMPVLFIGHEFFTGGIKSLIHGNPNMDTLVAIGSGSSFLYSLVMTFLISDNPHCVHNLYFESSAVIITLIMLGKYFEARSKKKTGAAIEKLVRLTPDTALLEIGGVTVETPVSELNAGDSVMVRAGDRIPLDAVITDGESNIDESMLTGESMPVYKKIGDAVVGGSVNLSHSLHIKITRTGEDTTLAKIIRFVEEAQGGKAPVARLADKVAGIFVPVVMTIAVIAAAVWLILGQDFSFALRIFTSVLVIACPCALGLATPTAVMTATGSAATSGILIRNGEVLETTHAVDIIALDKTGTITKGVPVVTDIVSADESELLILAALAEGTTAHPIADAVISEANKRGIASDLTVKSSETLAGKGVSAVLSDGRVINVCSPSAAESMADCSEYLPHCDRLSSEGKTMVYVIADGVPLGIIAVADEIAETSAEAISMMKQQGIKVVMITGDSKSTAVHIARKAGIDEIEAEVLPEEKAAVIERLRQGGKKVLMVGDGINDAPALAKADISCAIGKGSDIAVEASDIILMKSDLRDVVTAVKLSRRTMRIIKQNLFWAFFYNTIGIPIAAGVLYGLNGLLLNPMIGGLAMSFSSVCVVSNALRLRKKVR